MFAVVAYDDPVEAFLAWRSVQALRAFGPEGLDVVVRVIGGAPGPVWEGFPVPVLEGPVEGLPAGAVLRPGADVAVPEGMLAAYLERRAFGAAGGYLDMRERLTPVGLMRPGGLTGAAREEVARLNAVFSGEFDNRLFWSWRYASDPGLGSGKGSRGVYVGLKRFCLRKLGLERAASVLDVGCGDLEVVGGLELRGYLGLDLAETALERARERRPGWAFEQAALEPGRHGPAEVVLCLDVLIHQVEAGAYRRLVGNLAAATGDRLIVSGYEASPGDGHMIGFHEPLSETLAATGAFASVVAVTRYRGTTLIVADREGSRFGTAEPLDMLDIGEILFSYLEAPGR